MIDQLLKKLFGMNGHKKAVVQQKTEEADFLSHQLSTEIRRVTRKVNRLNQQTNSKLDEIHADLESITYRIAVATGGKKRGLP